MSTMSTADVEANNVSPGNQGPNLRYGDKLPLILCIGWGVGTFGISVMFNSVNLLLQRYATDFLGIAAGTYGVIYFLTKIYDAVTDPLMGMISDRTKSRAGRRRPYLLLGGLICAIAFISLFHAPSVEETPYAVVFFALLLILYSTGYTIFNVPYLAMPAEMTTHYYERSRLISFRVYAIGFGSVAGLSFAPMLVTLWGGGRVGHTALSWVFGALILAASIICFLATKKARATTHVTKSNLSRKEKFDLIRTNKPFSILVGVKTAHLAALAVTQAAIIYFVVYVLERGYGSLGLIGLASAIGMLVGNPIWLAAAKRFRDKRLLYIVASIFGGLVALTWVFSSVNEPMTIILLRKFLHGIATAGSLLFGQSMLPDAIAHDARRSGLRREGVFAGIFTTAEKFAFALGGGIAGIFLGYMGYVSSTTGTAVQPDSAILAIYMCVSVIPAVILFLSAALLTQYDLDEAEVEATSAWENQSSQENER